MGSSVRCFTNQHFWCRTACASGRNRTYSPFREQIYSLPQLSNFAANAYQEDKRSFQVELPVISGIQVRSWLLTLRRTIVPFFLLIIISNNIYIIRNYFIKVKSFFIFFAEPHRIELCSLGLQPSVMTTSTWVPYSTDRWNRTTVIGLWFLCLTIRPYRHMLYSLKDLHLWPSVYQTDALTNWAKWAIK